MESHLFVFSCVQGDERKPTGIRLTIAGEGWTKDRAVAHAVKRFQHMMGTRPFQLADASTLAIFGGNK